MRDKARARLPDSAQPQRLVSERDEILRSHKDGTLFRLHRHLAERLEAYEAEIGEGKRFWLGDMPVSDNALWCLLRRDVESLELPISPRVVRKMFDISLKYIRDKADISDGERVKIVCVFAEDA